MENVEVLEKQMGREKWQGDLALALSQEVPGNPRNLPQGMNTPITEISLMGGLTINCPWLSLIMAHRLLKYSTEAEYFPCRGCAQLLHTQKIASNAVLLCGSCDAIMIQTSRMVLGKGRQAPWVIGGHVKKHSLHTRVHSKISIDQSFLFVFVIWNGNAKSIDDEQSTAMQANQSYFTLLERNS